MPVSDLCASTRRLLSNLLGRSRNVSLAAALVPLGAVGMSSALAAPTVDLPPEFPVTPFSIRVTDMERLPGDAEGDAFRVEIQVLNWTNRSAGSFSLAANTGTSSVDGILPFISGSSIDADGRGGPPGGQDIGPGVFDPIAIHSGRGRGDLLAFQSAENKWLVGTSSPSLVHWSAYDMSIPSSFPVANFIPFGSLLSNPSRPDLQASLVPGYGTDALGDTAIDGGPGPYDPPTPGRGPFGTLPGFPEGSFWALDGFVFDVDDWDEGEVFSLNWFLASVLDFSSGLSPNNPFVPMGTSTGGNLFGFGVMNLIRIEPSLGETADNLPGPVFLDNTGFDQSSFSFYDTVYEIPNPAEFAAEFGAGITAPFLNPADNIFDVGINTRLIPEPSSVILVGCGLLGILGIRGTGRRTLSKDD